MKGDDDALLRWVQCEVLEGTHGSFLRFIPTELCWDYEMRRREQAEEAERQQKSPSEYLVRGESHSDTDALDDSHSDMLAN